MVTSTIRLFADDCLLYRKIDNNTDAELLQHDLVKLQTWENTWLMDFNPKKCEVLRVTNKRKPIITDYSIHGSNLATVDSAKYLGLTISSNLSWNSHIENISNKANNITALIKRNLSACPAKIKETCYNTLIRPVVEYASIVWDPIKDKNKNKIEMVQRKAARMVTGDYRTTSSVTEMIKCLGWTSLEQRRKSAKASMMFKITKDLVEVNTNDLKLSTTRTRGHHQRYIVPTSKLQSHLQSFFPSTIRIWNNLPDDAVEAPSVAELKRILEHIFV